MRDDPLMALERELVRAAERQVGRSLAPGRRRRVLALALLAAVIPVLAVLVVVGRIDRRDSGAVPGADHVLTLRSELAVLRDGRGTPPVGPALRRALVSLVPRRAPVGRVLEVRRLQVPAHASRRPPGVVDFELVLVRDPSGTERLALAGGLLPDGRQVPSVARAYRGLRFFTTAAVLARRGMGGVLNTSPSGAIVVEVVPDGVRRVAIAVPGQPIRSAPVSDNAVAFDQAGTLFVASGGQATFIWYGAHGRAIRRVGPRGPAVKLLRRPG